MKSVVMLIDDPDGEIEKTLKLIKEISDEDDGPAKIHYLNLMPLSEIREKEFKESSKKKQSGGVAC